MLANRPLEELNDKNDYLGMKRFADNFADIIINKTIDIDEFNMIALFGKWGSGKTSVMNHVISSRKSVKHTKAFLFEAWKYENDDDLALSLFEFIIDKLQSKDIIDKIDRSLAKSLKLCYLFLKNSAFQTSVGSELLGITYNVGEAGKITLDEYNDYLGPKSMYGLSKLFHDEYKTIVNKLMEHSDIQRLVIMVDDLDRCDPETVLKLLSMIKHFFIHDELIERKIVFVTGVDKEAVSKALLYKYHDLVKAEEYLEKIFDFSFRMPQEIEIEKMIVYYFSEKNTNIMNDIATKAYKSFFESLSFTNPRHLKKVLNQYEYYKKSIESGFLSIENGLIPNPEKVELTLFTLYFIICKEFFKDTYNNLMSCESKIVRLKENVINYNVNLVGDTNQHNVIFDQFSKLEKYIKDPFYSLDTARVTISNKVNTSGRKAKEIRSEFGLVLYLLPDKLPKGYYPEYFGKSGYVIDYFNHEFLAAYAQGEDEIEINFIKYLIDYSSSKEFYGISYKSNISIMRLLDSINSIL
jgi:hypothetical protein